MPRRPNDPPHTPFLRVTSPPPVPVTRYTATLAIGLVVFLAGMVMSFLVLPGLDACPADETVAISLDETGTAVEGVATAAGGENSSRGLQLLALSARGMLSSSQAGEGMMEDVPGFASAGGDFDFSSGDEDGGGCFEGSNALGSVRTILQVGRAEDRCIRLKTIHVGLNNCYASLPSQQFLCIPFDCCFISE